MQHRNRLAPLAGSAAAVVLVTAAIFLLRESVPVSPPRVALCARRPSRGDSLGPLLGGARGHREHARVQFLLGAGAHVPPVGSLELARPCRLPGHRDRGQRSLHAGASAGRRGGAARAGGGPAQGLLVALLQGESLVDELPRIGSATGSVLGVEGARIELGDEAGSGIELLAGPRLIGRLALPDAERPNPSAARRFLPALASLLAVGLDREELQRQALAAEGLRTSDAVKTAILRAVSHDLRSPLTAIRVAAESLTSPSLQLSVDDRRRQLETLRV